MGMAASPHKQHSFTSTTSVHNNEERQRLERLFGDYDFSNDISALDHIVEYYQVIEEEDDIFMLELVKKLPLMRIDWEPPSYQELKGTITRVLSEPHLGPYRTDRFTHDEDLLLLENWNHLQKKFKIPNKPQSFARWRNKDKNKTGTCPYEQARGTVTAHLARGLQRTLQQVYLHFVFEYAYPVKGAYSPLETRIMAACFENFQSAKSTTILSKVLGREPRGIYKRFKIFFGGKVERNTIKKWTLESATKLVQSMMKHTGVNLKNLKDRTIDKETWMKVQEDMDVPYDLLKYAWYGKFHTQCFLEISVTTKQIRRNLYKVLKRGGYKRWRDIRWDEVATSFPDGCTARFLHNRARVFVRDYCRDYLRRPMSDVLRAWRRYTTYRNNRRLKLMRLDSKGNLVFKKIPEQTASGGAVEVPASNLPE